MLSRAEGLLRVSVWIYWKFGQLPARRINRLRNLFSVAWTTFLQSTPLLITPEDA